MPDNADRELLKFVMEAPYKAFLHRLHGAAKKRGLAHNGLSELVEHALGRLAEEWGLPEPPRRMPPIGGRREGSGRKPAGPGEG